MSRISSIPGLFLIIVLLAPSVSAQRAECLDDCNNQCNACVSSAQQAWTNERMIIWDNYYDTVAEAEWNYMYCCWEFDDGSGYPPGWGACYSAYQQALNMATFSRNASLDFAAIMYEMEVSTCMSTYNSCTLSCPIAWLPQAHERVAELGGVAGTSSSLPGFGVRGSLLGHLFRHSDRDGATNRDAADGRPVTLKGD